MRMHQALIATALLLLPTSVAYAATDVYADAVAATWGSVYQSENAIGAPDGIHADFLDTDVYVTLDLGESERGVGDLLLYTELMQSGAIWQVDFLDDDQNVMQTASGYVPNYTATVTVDYVGDAPYRYVRVWSVEDERYNLDAVEVTATETMESEEPAPEMPVEEPAEEEVPTEETSLERGLLVKLVDDGDPSTAMDAAVYVLDGEGKRHAFPNETVFSSWYADYEALAYIDPENLASYQLGENVTVRPGTHLVKITTDPKVYAVEPGSILRWVSSEQIAEQLYGTDWADRVIDVADTFFNDYEIGEPIETAVHPSGTYGYLHTGEIVYIKNGVYYTVAGLGNEMRFQSKFLVEIIEATGLLYVDGGDLSLDPEIQWPY